MDEDSSRRARRDTTGDEVVGLLAEVRAAVRTRAVFEQLVADAVGRATAAGATRAAVARSLGVHRATLYRHFPDVALRHDAGDVTEGAESCTP